MASLIWFIAAFFVSLCALFVAGVLAQRQERHRDLQEKLQALRQDVALGYFHHALKDLQNLPISSLHQEEMDLLKAQCLHGLGDTDSVLEHLKTAISRCPKSEALHLQLAEHYVSCGEYQQALAIYDVLSEASRKSAMIPYAKALFFEKKYLPCIQSLSSYAGKPNGELFDLMGHSYFYLNEYTKALDYFHKAQNLNHSSQLLLENKAFSQMALKRYGDALASWKTLFTTNAHHEGAILEMSLCMQHIGDFKQALRLYEAAPRWLQEHSRYHADLGHCYFHVKNYKKSTHHLLTAYEMGDCRPQILVTCAISLERQRLWVHAQCLYSQLINEHPLHHSGWAGLSYLFGIGKSEDISPQKAIEMAIKAVRFLPCRPAWEILSAVYARCGRFDKAHDIQESLQQSLKTEIASERKKISASDSEVLEQIKLEGMTALPRCAQTQEKRFQVILQREAEVVKHREVMRGLRKRKPPSIRQVPHIMCA